MPAFENPLQGNLKRCMNAGAMHIDWQIAADSLPQALRYWPIGR